MHFTSSEKASSVPGRMHTAVVESSGAANPRVPVLKLVVASLSPTLADSVARVGIAWHHRSRVARIRPVRNCRGGVDQVADILPHDGGPSLRAYVCPDCGAVDSVLVYPHQHHFRPEANPRRHGKWR